MKGFLFLGLAVLASMQGQGQSNYPPTKTVDVSDTYFGITYPDPYRWLENRTNKDVEAWFKTQAELTDKALARIPGRDALLQEWLAMDQLKSAFYSGIRYENGRVFYKKISSGENVGKLYLREGWDGIERLLFDPSRYELQFKGIGRQGDMTTIYSFVPSWDGKHVAIALTRSGAEYSEIRVLDVEHETLLPESIHPSFGCYGWTPDGRGFFYDGKKFSDLTRPDIKLNSKTKLHELGTEVANDRDFFSNESCPELGIASNERAWACLEESRPDYILGRVHTAQAELQIFYAPVTELEHQKIKWDVLCRRSDNLVQGPVFHGNYVYAVSQASAPRGKLVRTSVQHPDWEHAETLIPERIDSIQSVTKSSHYLLIVYSDGIVGRLIKYDQTTGKAVEIKLPASGTVDVSCPDWQSDHCLVLISSWTSAILYECDLHKDTFAKSVFSPNRTYAGSESLVSEEFEVPGHDGTLIPLSIIRKRGLPLDGSNSCILEGYGAYGSSILPRFSIVNSVASRGVVRAYAHVRGGGEKGERWHRAGYKTTKPNTWKDFISCAEYLVNRGYTSPHKLAAIGGSAGGITVSRAIEERPELFAAAVCDSPLVNPMRAEFTANGPGNIPEFGTVKDPVESQALFEMDGFQHVHKGVKYPAVMGVGGWNDQRVPVWQPGKFVAALQADSTSGKPVLLKVNYDSGHGTEEKVAGFKDLAGQFAFLLWQTGHKDFQPAK